MSGRRVRFEEVGSSNPTLIDRTPRIIDRSPEEEEEIANNRVSLESKRPRSTTYRLLNPFSRHNSVVVKQTTTTKRRDSDAGPSPLRRSTTVRNRRSSPPPPPIIVQDPRPRSSSPPRVRTMPGNEPQGRVPLPPRIPSEEEKRFEEQLRLRQQQQQQQQEQREREGRTSGRTSRQSREGTTPPYEEEARPRSRTRRPYSSGVRTSDNPFIEQERVVERERERVIEREPASPRRPTSAQNQHFDIVTPNEPVRSRNKANEIMSTKEYREMKAVAERNYQVAKEAVARCSTAEVQLQSTEAHVRTLKEQLVVSTMRENKQREKADQLEIKLEEKMKELELCKREHRIYSRERDVSLREAEDSREQLERERKDRKERDRERERDKGKERRDDTDSGEGSGRRRRGPRRVIIRQPASGDERDRERRENEPRTNYASNPTRRDITPTATRGDEDSGLAAIAKARADANKTR